MGGRGRIVVYADTVDWHRGLGLTFSSSLFSCWSDQHLPDCFGIKVSANIPDSGLWMPVEWNVGPGIWQLNVRNGENGPVPVTI